MVLLEPYITPRNKKGEVPFAMNDYSTKEEKCQQIFAELIDKNEFGKERPWKARKQQTIRLSNLYEKIDAKKADRLRLCGSKLQFRVSGSRMQLAAGMFCKVRLCPMCQWRRSRKIHMQMTQIIDEIQRRGDYTPVAINPTVRSCTAEELSLTIDRLLAGWRAVWKSEGFKKKMVGWYRALEITYNRETRLYHPHLHCIALGRLHYYKKGELPVEEVAAAFRRGAKIDYNPNLKMYALRSKRDQGWAEAMLEFCKYTVSENWDIPEERKFMALKEADLREEKLRELCEVVKTLDGALHHRRLIGMGGMIADVHKQLHFDDPEEGDLEKSGDAEADTLQIGAQFDVKEEEMITYVWRAGAYIVSSESPIVPEWDDMTGYRELKAMKEER